MNKLVSAFFVSIAILFFCLVYCVDFFSSFYLTLSIIIDLWPCVYRIVGLL